MSFSYSAATATAMCIQWTGKFHRPSGASVARAIVGFVQRLQHGVRLAGTVCEGAFRQSDVFREFSLRFNSGFHLCVSAIRAGRETWCQDSSGYMAVVRGS